MSSNKAIITSSRIKFIAYKMRYDVRNDHPRFMEIADALRLGKTRIAVSLYKSGLKETVKRELLLDDRGLSYKGELLPEVFAQVYSEVLKGGDVKRLKSLCLFFDNIASNPTVDVSRDAFARFLSKRRMVITDRGTFLAYKRVNHRYYDCYTNSFDNTPGSGLISMPRSAVDSDQNRECSTGYHQCSYEYLASYNGRHIIVTEVNPRDIVAVPPDYNFSKMRVCSYFPLCTLDEFKGLILMQAQDVLGTLPFFHTNQLSKLANFHDRYKIENLDSQSVPYYYQA